MSDIPVTAARRLGSLAMLIPMLVAVVPSLFVLQVLPRLVDTSTSAAATALGVGELIIPIVSAALAGSLAAALGAGSRAVVAAGAASQLPAIPGALELMLNAISAGYQLDATFWVVLYLAYSTLSVAAAYHAARWWTAGESRFDGSLGGRLSALALALGGVYLVWVVALLYFGAGAWFHLLALCAAGGLCGGTVAFRSHGALRNAGWALVVAAAGFTAFTVAVEIGLLLNPRPDLSDLAEFDNLDFGR